MNASLVLVLCAVAATILFGVYSNWIYEYLRKRGILSTAPSCFQILVASLVALILIVLVTYSQLSVDQRDNLVVFLNTSIPLWQSVVTTILSVLLVSAGLGLIMRKPMSENARLQLDLENRANMTKDSPYRSDKNDIIRPPQKRSH